jgi:hypothetical protein
MIQPSQMDQYCQPFHTDSVAVGAAEGRVFPMRLGPVRQERPDATEDR